MYPNDVKPGAVSNHLIDEKSPYLLQHAWNPVNWYPWGEQAFARAKEEDKPIFLSIGYATCHWCHVMAHESFEDDHVASLLNWSYIAIKVDREERPDIDKIYMSACQSLTGRGGWPLSVFITPEGKAFFAGTYFPKSSRSGMPGFVDVLNQIAEMWKNDRTRIVKSSEAVTAAIQPKSDSERSAQTPGVDTLRKGYTQLARTFDPRWGGFGAAPKFPSPHQLTFLLRWHKRSDDSMALQMVEKTLSAMRNGGIFDQIGFGFHRYSVDEKWLVPHFEKMLYDQALLAMAYTEAYLVTGNVRFATVAREIFTYVLRDMTAPEGGFYCAEDADSEGKEGAFYVWTPEEVIRHLGQELGSLFCRFYNIIDEGNFEEGLSIPRMRTSLEAFAESHGMDPKTVEARLKDARTTLFDIRKKRVHPLKDDKILTSWNGLMIAAFAKGHQVFGDQAYADAAQHAAGFILEHLREGGNGRLLRRYRLGEAAYPGYLDDYAFVVWAFIELYEATFEASCLEEALALNEEMIHIFWDEQRSGLYFTGTGNEPLVTRTRDVYDGAIPSGNSIAALNFLRLGRLTGNVDLEQRAEQLIRAFSMPAEQQPSAHTQLLIALDFLLGPSQEIVIAGDPAKATTQTMINAVHRRFLPNKVLLVRPPGSEGKRLATMSPFVKDMVPINDRSTGYVCERHTCKTPTAEIDRLESLLDSG